MRRGGVPAIAVWALRSVHTGGYAYNVRDGLYRAVVAPTERELWKRNQWARDGINKGKWESVQVRVRDIRRWEAEMNVYAVEGLEERTRAIRGVVRAAEERLRRGRSTGR